MGESGKREEEIWALKGEVEKGAQGEEERWR